jgi:hypothetical protein
MHTANSQRCGHVRVIRHKCCRHVQQLQWTNNHRLGQLPGHMPARYPDTGCVSRQAMTFSFKKKQQFRVRQSNMLHPKFQIHQSRFLYIPCRRAICLPMRSQHGHAHHGVYVKSRGLYPHQHKHAMQPRYGMRAGTQHESNKQERVRPMIVA